MPQMMSPLPPSHLQPQPVTSAPVCTGGSHWSRCPSPVLEGPFLIPSSAPNQAMRKIPPVTCRPVSTVPHVRSVILNNPSLTSRESMMRPLPAPNRVCLKDREPPHNETREKTTKKKDNLGDRKVGRGRPGCQVPIFSLANCPGGLPGEVS